MKNNVFVMLSGGVDSSVACKRLIDSGYNVTGVFMKNWSYSRLKNIMSDQLAQSCSDEEDLLYAKAVADHLGIKLKQVNFEKEYWESVIEPFFSGISKGATPNPDIWCNSQIKFGVFLDWALNNGADYVASGHYARLRRESDELKIKNDESNHNLKNSNLKIESSFSNHHSKLFLLRGVDPAKDQSYFLAQVPKEKLQYALFPIGHLKKSQVRAEAFTYGLPTASRKDSQGICFIGKIPIKEFLKERFKQKKGDMVLKDGTKVGEHDGAWFYTIGERLGATEIQNAKFKSQNCNAKLKNLKTDHRKPLYIVEKDIKQNILIVGQDDGSEPLWKKEFIADNWNWFTAKGAEGFEKPCQNEVYDIEIRYHQQPKSKGTIMVADEHIFQKQNKFFPAKNFSSTSPRWLPSGDTKPIGAAGYSSKQIRRFDQLKIENYKLKIQLVEAVRAVTPGQTVVLSRGDRIVGAGIIN